MRSIMFGVCAWLCAAACSAATPFDGKWTATVVRPAPAGSQDVTITLSTDQGGKVTGTMMLQGVTGEVPIEWGYVKDDLITYRIKVPGLDQHVEWLVLESDSHAVLSQLPRSEVEREASESKAVPNRLVGAEMNHR
jgi:hypothetical protein